MIDGTVQKVISPNPEKEDRNKERRFLKDKHQLDIVLGPGNVNWFDELTDRCITAMCRRKFAKHHLLEFDSPLSSPTVSQLIRNHVKVGDSPPEYYHSSPAVTGNYLQDVTPQSTPDNYRHWQKPTIGLSPSPVLKDGSSFQRSSLAIASLGLSHDDSTLSWTNSLATPPRLEDPGAETNEEDIQSRHKDPVRALFSPSPKLNTTGDSMEVLESTDDESNEDLFTEKVDDNFINPTDRNDVLSYTSNSNHSVENAEFDEKRNIQRDPKMVSTEVIVSCTENMVLDRKSMDSWRDNFKRKLMVKSDSFGKNCSAETSSHNIKCDEKLKSPAELFVRPVESVPNDYQNSEKADFDRKFSNLAKAEMAGEKPKDLINSSPEIAVQNIDCFSPVFIKHSSSIMKSRRPKLMETKQKKDSVTSVVVEALSDFFDTPSGLTSRQDKKRNLFEFDPSNIKHVDSLTEQSISTPENPVLQSILVKNRKSCGSSGKKVRFSDCVLKHSDHEDICGSYSNKRRKSRKLHAEIDVEVNKNMSVIIDEDASIKAGNHDVSEEFVYEHRDQTKASPNIVEKTVSDDEILIGEGEDVFSQISPTALELMCKVAHAAPGVTRDVTTVTTEKDKVESDVNQKSDNPGELDHNRSKTEALHDSKTYTLPDIQVKPKRFLYPSKQQIVVASPCEVFRYTEDEASDCKAKGIVMAIPVHKIVKSKNRNSDGKNCVTDNCKNKVHVNPESDRRKVFEAGGEHEENHYPEQTMLENESGSHSTRLQYESLDSPFKNFVSPGFRSASGKDLNLSEEALEKAKDIFKEQKRAANSGIEPNTNDTLNIRMSSIVPSNSLKYPLKFQEEDSEFTDVCEDFDQADLAQGSDNIDNATDLKQTEPMKVDHANEELIRPLKNEAEVSNSNHGNAQIVSSSTERVCIADRQQNDTNVPVHKKEVALDKKHHFDPVKESALQIPVVEPQKNLFDCCDMKNPVVHYQQSPGFITAGGKMLKLDKEKLMQAKTLFAVDDDSYEMIQSSNSYDASTVPNNDNGHKVVDEKHAGEVSRISKSCDMFGNTVNFAYRSRFDDFAALKPVFDGFSTASGKSCNLSSSSMIKAEKLLLDNEDGVQLSLGKENIVGTSQKESAILQKENSVILHEFLEGKLHGEKSPFRNQVYKNESSSQQKANSANDSIQNNLSVTGKDSFLTLADKSNKPKGFRPFKAPKRISVSGSNTDKYPASVCQGTEQTKVDHTESSTNIKSCLSAKRSPVYNTRIMAADDYDNCDKVHVVNSLSQDVIKPDDNTDFCSKTDKNNFKIAKMDICEGIFSQMFADDMEAEDSLCPPIPCINVKETRENFPCVTDSESVDKTSKGIRGPSVSHQEAPVAGKSSEIDLQLCKEKSTKEMQYRIVMPEIQIQQKKLQKIIKQNGDFCSNAVEKGRSGDQSAFILSNLSQENETDVKCGSCQVSENTTTVTSEQLSSGLRKKILVDVRDTDQDGEKERKFSECNILSNVLQKAEKMVGEKNKVNCDDISVNSFPVLNAKAHNGTDANIKDTFDKGFNDLDRFADKLDANIETGFQGFQTASGSIVKMSKTALEIAKANFNRIENNFGEILQNCVHTVSNRNESKDLCTGNTEIESKKELIEIEKKGLPEVNIEAIGRKQVTFSDEGLSSTKNTCTGMPDSHILTGFQTMDDMAVNISANALIKAEESLSNLNDMDNNTDINILCSSNGMDDCGSLKESTGLDVGKISNDSSCHAAQGPVWEVPNETLMLERDELKHKDGLENETVKPKENSAGFTTAKCTAVKLSDEAKKHAGEKLEEFNGFKDMNLRKEIMFQGFQTAKGTTIHISNEAVEHAREQFEHVDELIKAAVTEERKFTGFHEYKSTAVNVVDKNEEHAKQQFKPADGLKNVELKDGKQFDGFQTAKETAVKVSDIALQYGRQRFELTDGPQNVSLVDESEFKGFQAAKGTAVNVSDAALKHARQQFDHGGPQNEGCEEEKKIQGFQTAKGTAVKVSDKALQYARQQFELTDGPQNVSLVDENEFKGFQTAKGRAVIVSDAALKHVKQQFEHSDGPQDFTLVDEGKFKGFQTAKGRAVTVSDKALEYVKQQYEHSVALQNVSFGNENKFPGFQTAKGTAVTISDKALEYARESFDHTDGLQNVTLRNDNKFLGFQTAKGTAVKISDQALQHTRDQLDDADRLEIIPPWKEVLFEGYKIETGLPVNKCEEDFINTWETQCISNDFVIGTACKERNFLGFQTARGSAVKVSAQPLQHARQHLDHAANFESDTFRKESKDQGLETAPCSEENTAGKAVVHSYDQLLKCDMEGPPFVDQESIKRGFQLDVELPYKRQKLGHHLERGILHQSANSNSTAKRKPLRSGPDGMTTDRRHPGFRPFIPVHSRSIGEKSSQRNEVSQLPVPYNDAKSPFRTPYKTVGGQKQSDNRESESSDLIGRIGPVFHCKRKSSEVEVDTKSPFQTPYKKVDIQKQSADRCSGPSDKDCKRGPVLHSKMKSSNEEVNMIPSDSHNIGCQCEKYESDSVMLDKAENETKFKENDSKLLAKIGNTENLSNATCTLSSIRNRKNTDCYMSESVLCDHENISMETGEIGLSSQDEEDVFYCNLVEARKKQDNLIHEKKMKKIEPVTGRLYLMKTTNLAGRVSLKDVITRPRQQTGRKRISVTSETAVDYRFDLTDCYGKHMDSVLLGDGALLVPDDGGKAGRQEFHRAFLTMDGVDPKLVCDGWINNHYRWIVWKLASYEIACSGLCGRSLTPENVMLQLKYRYDREIDRAERSALKKIYEKDDTASKRLVLCVSSVRFLGTESNAESRTAFKMNCTKVHVELTDGWYRILALLDGPLTNMFLSGKIITGQKLCITGAELIGSESACTPLEAPETIQLKININSTRLAPWDSPMGYQKDPCPLCVPLVSLFDEGGTVGVVDVVLVRKYSTMYMEKLPGGGCVFRSWRDEEKVQQQYQTQRQAEMEKMYNQIQEQIEKEQIQESKKQRGCKKFSKSDIEELSTGEEIHEAIENAAQPDIVQNYLTDKQHSLLYEYQRCIQDEKRQELNMRIQSALREKEDEMPVERNVTPLLKFRIAGCSNKDLDYQKTTILTVWRPAAEISDLKEGKRYKIYSLNTSAARSRYIGHNVQLTSTKQTKFLLREIDENRLDRIYEPREVLWVSDIKRKQPPYGEFDFVGFIVKLVSAVTTDRVHSPDLMYLADCQCNILCVKFWNGFKSFGENLLTEARCICLCNVMDKAVYRNNYLPTVEATPEFTNITVKPQTSGQRHALDKLQSVIKEKVTFKDDVVSALDELLYKSQNNSTPKRFQKQKSDETTSSLTSVNQELNLASDDFDMQEYEKELLQVLDKHESNVTNSEKQPVKSDKNVINREKHVINDENNIKESVSVTPSSQSRQTGIQSKIAKLSAYATPDSLSPLPVSVSSSVSKGFKPPAFRKKLN